MNRITIVGGGVAGLTLAGALDPGRFKVQLIERRPGLPEVGTGFGMWPFVMDALGEIGLAAEVRAAAVPVPGGRLVMAGRQIEIGGQQLLLIPRPDLLRILDRAVPDTVLRDARGVTDVDAEEGELVVAADGARSVVRRQIWGQVPRRRSTVAIRGILPEPNIFAMAEFWGQGLLFGISRNAHDTTNWYAAGSGVPSDRSAALAWARTAFTDFPEPVCRLLRRVSPDDLLVNPILEARPVFSLVRGRYVLIGDAAHAMAPNLGRGAGESIVDAVVLARELNRHGIANGMRAYARQRLVKPQFVRAGAELLRRISLGGPTLHRVLAAAAHASSYVELGCSVEVSSDATDRKPPSELIT